MKTYAVYLDNPLQGMPMDKCIELFYSKGFSAAFIRMILEMKYQGSWASRIGTMEMSRMIRGNPR